MGSPRDALDLRNRHIDALTHPYVQRHAQFFLEDVARKGNGPVIRNTEGAADGWAFCNRERLRLREARVFWITADMVALARWAAAGLEVDDTFDDDVWPCDVGMFVLEKPHHSREVWGRTTGTKALVWSREKPLMATFRDGSTPQRMRNAGTYVTAWADPQDPEDEVSAEVHRMMEAAGQWEEHLRQAGPLALSHAAWILEGQRVGPAVVEPSPDYAKWALSYKAEGYPGSETLQVANEADNDSRFLLALLMLIQQRITTVEVAMADRHTRKRMAREGLGSDVTVIDVRKPDAGKAQQPGESTVEWKCRWLVEGGWQWRACSDKHPGARPYPEDHERVGNYRTRVYVSPYVKNAGRTDLPLQTPDKVYRVGT